MLQGYIYKRKMCGGKVECKMKSYNNTLNNFLLNTNYDKFKLNSVS